MYRTEHCCTHFEYFIFKDLEKNISLEFEADMYRHNVSKCFIRRQKLFIPTCMTPTVLLKHLYVLFLPALEIYNSPLKIFYDQ